jgi:hypothetical protein
MWYCSGGAWGPGSFENDDALDWASEFNLNPRVAVLVETLRVVAEALYIEAPDGSAAIAAA